MRQLFRNYRQLLLISLVLIGASVLTVAAPVQAAGVCTDISPYSVLSGSTETITITNIDIDTDAEFVDLAGLQIVKADLTAGTDTISFDIPSPGLPTGTYTIRVYDIINNVICRVDLTVIDFTVPPVPGPTKTPQPTAFARPLITVVSYGASSQRLSVGQDFDWELNLQNSGSIVARNVVVTFEPGDFVPRVTGGVQAIGEMGPGGGAKLIQPFTATKDLAGKPFATLNVTVEYTDNLGASYTGAFTLTYPAGPAPGSGGHAGPTLTPTTSPRPQLVITVYKTDPEILQPGTPFALKLDVRNLGTSSAKAVSMIVGGGGTSGSGSDGTQAAPGGVSGGSGEFTNFAPLGSSNVQFLGDVTTGQTLAVSQSLIVNVTTNPGAYPFKVSLVYTDDKGKPYTDDQVITLLVRYIPQMEVSFYQDPGPMFVGQPNLLPIQIVNLGKKDVTIGKMEVSGPGQFTNASTTIGPLAPGGYFTLDAQFIPEQVGPVELTVTANYVDEFNVNQTITQTLMMEVQEASVFGPGEGGIDGGGPVEPMPPPEETFFDVIVRFFKGLLGLGSQRDIPAGGEIIAPGESFPIQNGGGGGGQGIPVPAPKGP